MELEESLKRALPSRPESFEVEISEFASAGLASASSTTYHYHVLLISHEPIITIHR